MGGAPLCRTFRENPHPNEEERSALSKRLNLEPRQIKVRPEVT